MNPGQDHLSTSCHKCFVSNGAMRGSRLSDHLNTTMLEEVKIGAEQGGFLWFRLRGPILGRW